MSYDTSSDTKVVNLNPVGYSPEATSMPSPVASMPPTTMDGGKLSRRSSSSGSSGSSSAGSRRYRKSRERERESNTSSSEDDYEEDYSDDGEDGKEKAADKVVVKKDGSVRSGSSKSSRSSRSSEASSYSEEEESEEEEDAISMTSTEILENDPLFFVLSRIFVTHDKKKNIADLLQEVVDLLKEQRDHRMQRMQGGHPGGHSSAVPMQKY